VGQPESTFRQEIAGGYLWSPNATPNGARIILRVNARSPHLENLIIFLRRSRVAAIGIAKSYCWGVPETNLSFGSVGQNWEKLDGE